MSRAPSSPSTRARRVSARRRQRSRIRHPRHRRRRAREACAGSRHDLHRSRRRGGGPRPGPGCGARLRHAPGLRRPAAHSCRCRSTSWRSMTANRAQRCMRRPSCIWSLRSRSARDLRGPRVDRSARAARAGRREAPPAAGQRSRRHAVLRPSDEHSPWTEWSRCPSLSAPRSPACPPTRTASSRSTSTARSRLEAVYAAGDATDFPIKQGGLATQQADAVAERIAARAGAPSSTATVPSGAARHAAHRDHARSGCATRPRPRRGRRVRPRRCGGRRPRSRGCGSAATCWDATNRPRPTPPHRGFRSRSASTARLRHSTDSPAERTRWRAAAPGGVRSCSIPSGASSWHSPTTSARAGRPARSPRQRGHAPRRHHDRRGRLAPAGQARHGATPRPRRARVRSRPLGWVTDSGLLRWLERDLRAVPAAHAITEPPHFIEPGATAREALEALAAPASPPARRPGGRRSAAGRRGPARPRRPRHPPMSTEQTP